MIYIVVNIIEWDFINSLKYEEQLDCEEARFIKISYVSMLKKVLQRRISLIMVMCSSLKIKFNYIL